MYPKGTIYSSSDKKSHKTIELKAPFAVRIMYGTLRGIGGGLIGFAVIALSFTFGPVLVEEYNYHAKEKTEVTQSRFESLLNIAEAEKTARTRTEAQKLGLNPAFSVVIPKIDAKANIMANTNAADEDSYEEALKQGIAHAAGTYFPGQGERIFLFAHSTDSPINFSRYNAIFYLLRKMEQGDRITVYFADNKYEYKVTEKRVVEASDTSWLNGNTNEEELVLQTCDPPGTTLKRLLVIARPVE